MIVFPSVVEIAIFILLVIVGLIVLALVRAVLFLLPAILVAVVVWCLTGTLTWAGVAFVAVTILSLLKRH